MHSRAATALFTIIRIAAGLVIALTAMPFLIQGGLSRYAKYGIPAHADWRYIAIGLGMVALGTFLIRPFWWRHISKR